MMHITRRRLSLLFVDGAIILFTGFLAVALRDNFEFSAEKLAAGWVYHVAVVAATICIIPLVGLDRSIWRFSSLSDYLMLSVTCFFIIAAASLVTLIASRFDDVARTIPIIHYVVATFVLIAIRVAFRRKHDRRRRRSSLSSPDDLLEGDPKQYVHVLVVGLNRLAETYIEAVEEFASERIRVVGLVSVKDRHVGRLVATCPVLGAVEDVETIIRDLEPHGTKIERIVVAEDFNQLSDDARWSLLRLESNGECDLQIFAEQLDLVDRDTSKSILKEPHSSDRRFSAPPPLRFSFPASLIHAMSRRPYWSAKRAIDATAALLLLLVLSPVIIVTAVVVGFFIGFPVAFWQQRPGLGGAPFRLYKFRTMHPAHDANGRRLTDDERLSHVGIVLRRFRLDELPQLFNILIGDMSFVGPRPLLPRDQSSEDRARLLVRPGLTGWAQVVGGREISAEDKAALDVWYVKNATLWLDLKIAIRTIAMLVAGETIHRSQVAHALQELRRDGILSG